MENIDNCVRFGVSFHLHCCRYVSMLSLEFMLLEQLTHVLGFIGYLLKHLLVHITVQKVIAPDLKEAFRCWMLCFNGIDED